MKKYTLEIEYSETKTHFVFEGNNKYYKGKFTLEEAIKCFITLKDCKDTIDSEFCKDVLGGKSNRYCSYLTNSSNNEYCDFLISSNNNFGCCVLKNSNRNGYCNNLTNISNSSFNKPKEK